MAALAASGLLIGCGGDDDYEKSMRRADAAQVGYDIAKSCLNGPSLLASEVSEKVDKLLDLYEASDHDASIKSDIRDTAGTLRDCGSADQADRLNSATD